MKSAGRERRCRPMVLAAALIVAAASCRDSDPPPSGDPDVTAPSTTFEPATTTASSAPITATIPLNEPPPTVDLIYAQRVLDEINRIDHEAAIILFREKGITPEHEAMMSAIYFGQALNDAQKARSTDLSVGLSTWRDPPGRRVTTAKRILTSRPDCIALMARSDSRPRYQEQVDVLEDIGVVLQRNVNPTAEEQRFNPSLWMQTIGGTIVPGKDLGEVCR